MTVLLVACLLLNGTAPAEDHRPAGRYLDRTTLVHESAQLNPLHQVADLVFTGRLSVADAIRSTLTGTGYRLLPPEEHPHDGARALLRSRLAISHLSFEHKRVDSVLVALIGRGRGYELEIDHLGRRIRVVPSSSSEPRSSVM